MFCSCVPKCSIQKLKTRKKSWILVAPHKHLSDNGIIYVPFWNPYSRGYSSYTDFPLIAPHRLLHIDWYLVAERWGDIFNLLSWDKDDSWNPIRLPGGVWTAWCIIWILYSYLWTVLWHVLRHGSDSTETEKPQKRFPVHDFFPQHFFLSTVKLMTLKTSMHC